MCSIDNIDAQEETTSGGADVNDMVRAHTSFWAELELLYSNGGTATLQLSVGTQRW